MTVATRRCCIHKGLEFEKAEKVPDFNPETDAEEWGVILDLLREPHQETDPKRYRWQKVADGCYGVSEETTTGVAAPLSDGEAAVSCSSRRSTSTTRSPRASSTTSTDAVTRCPTASCARATSCSAARSCVMARLRPGGSSGCGPGDGVVRVARVDRDRDRSDLRIAGRDGRLPGHDPRGRRRDGRHLHHHDGQLRHHQGRAHGQA